jgi:threonine synthase
MAILYHSTNDRTEQVGFRKAILNGIASHYGLYMMDRDKLPKLSLNDLRDMESKSYAEIAFRVLLPFVEPDVPESIFMEILEDVYDEKIIPVGMERVTGNAHLLWLSRGPTYSFKDFAARFFGRVLNYFLGEGNLKRVVVVATSGDTGGAVAHALLGLENVSNIVFFPNGSISEQQRRQMTTLGENIHAFAVNGDFDVCQEIAKTLLGDRELSYRCFSDRDRFTSANSISLGRLLPQAVYPFFAHSRLRPDGEKIVTSIPSGNFGDMMGTVIAKEVGLPIHKIVVGVNENREFPDFLCTGTYTIEPSKWSPSTAMIVSHPSNFARLIEFYGGHLYDHRDTKTNKVTKPGILKKLPDLKSMQVDMYSTSISNDQHYETIGEVYRNFGVILDPHGSVGWKALERYTEGNFSKPAVVYETADPGKFPEDIEKAIGIKPEIPEGIKNQAHLEERIYEIGSAPFTDDRGTKRMDAAQYREVQEKIHDLFNS